MELPESQLSLLARERMDQVMSLDLVQLQGFVYLPQQSSKQLLGEK